VSPEKSDNASETSVSSSELIGDRGKLMALIDRAQNGDNDALPALRKVLNQAPRVARFVDLARNVERSIIEEMSGDDAFIREAMPRNLKTMRTQIAGENPSTLERLLAERIVVCWLELQYFQTIYMQNLNNMTIPQSDHHQRRIDKAHRRYLSSVKALAQIRKLGPAVQINIAEKQINTTG
jgi:hypothetical protein